jgi:hypothetical protein
MSVSVRDLEPFAVRDVQASLEQRQVRLVFIANVLVVAVFIYYRQIKIL